MRSSVLGLGLCLLTAGIVSADVIDSNTVNFDVTATGGPTNQTPMGALNGQLDQFNPGPGQTLTGVTIDVFYNTFTMNIEAQTPVVGGPQAPIVGDFDL